ncbi:sigma-54-dependent Fis family transcriptional regulator [Anoxybacillus sp. UARK-01]|uniref:sigma-54 interaction domain-containing protein n=1 Tax=Anoxybacillus sp. UARK-01 TaxID=1895648 RepID=UPI0009B98D59|nr:sigma 54-interacting transcriptional regulator [Anoxybacillus sp. UARK-01]OQM46750.1 sigma-54-dependent Fis family transcriptional regulator [Anoxybacillus sp. UARK-01]
MIFQHQILEAVINNAYEWIVVVDEKGNIIYMNKNYCEFLERKQEEVIGKHVTEVIENTRMHIVVKTGKEEIADLHYIKGNYMIANRIPIVVDGRVIGAVGTVIFRDTNEWKRMNSHIKSLLLQLQTYFQEWTENNGAKYTLTDLISCSKQMEELKEKVKRIADSDISVLIRGESGTGKELFAHSIHQLSSRSQKPFVKVNCGAIPEHLLESELFGYEEGAFTGAKKGGKKGKFQLADGGTIFLDEIGDLPLHMQVKLLRVLQEKEMEPIGSTKTVAVDVRIIAATNRPLEKMVEEKRFREDLYYRINVIPFVIPPLRERPGDIEMLAYHFMKKIAKRSGKRVNAISAEVMKLLRQHVWPGNIRELENVMEVAVHFANGETITVDALPEYLKANSSYQMKGKTLKELLEETEKAAIQQSLQRCGRDKQKAAKELGISKSAMYEKIKKYGLS